jgi:hypothetical protein
MSKLELNKINMESFEFNENDGTYTFIYSALDEYDGSLMSYETQVSSKEAVLIVEAVIFNLINEGILTEKEIRDRFLKNNRFMTKNKGH